LISFIFRSKILTGPNASGKTIYVKQVGLLVYMSMIGSFVAAKEAELGDFDRIYTRLSSIECISLQMSSFSIDLKQLSDALNGATRRSLVLIDELGRGTELVDGQALVAATIRFLVSRRFPTASHSPHVYLITHFYDILHGGETLFGERISRLSYLSLENFVKGSNDPYVN
jgi:DNA mismatch repair protein MSH5